MNYKSLELKLRKQIEKRLSEGYTLVPGLSCIVNDQCFCAVGSLTVEAGGRQYLDEAIDAWACDANIVESISDGFEGATTEFLTFEPRDDRAFEIGRRLRRIYCDDNGETE